MTNPVCPETGAPMYRGVRPMTLTYKGESITRAFRRFSIRSETHLSQEAAGLMIGGGPRAFQKYESGDLSPSRAASSALALLDHNPKALSVLKIQRKAA